MKINVECSISDENEQAIDVNEIIDKVKKMSKKEMTYLSTELKTDNNSYELNCKDDNIDVVGNVYFIFNGKALLYVGKSLNVKNRLHQHLVKCNKKTYSKIQAVHEYLKEKHKLKLSYCA
ncbi:MAG: GIY-YIG nuclease family protein, partial [Clostridia bacterium]|nr:GIY-YIG nuclease family protein [Clostridia bacterium]